MPFLNPEIKAKNIINITLKNKDGLPFSSDVILANNAKIYPKIKAK